jgi:hypothetical protein
LRLGTLLDQHGFTVHQVGFHAFVFHVALYRAVYVLHVHAGVAVYLLVAELQPLFGAAREVVVVEVFDVGVQFGHRLAAARNRGLLNLVLHFLRRFGG